MKIQKLTYLLMFYIINSTIGANILILFPFQSRSMRHIVAAYASSLRSRGHNITILGMYPLKPEERLDGVTELHIPGLEKELATVTDNLVAWTREDSYVFYLNIIRVSFNLTKLFVDHPLTQSWAAETSPVYDIAIVNGIYCNFALPVACHVAKKCIMLSPTDLLPWIAHSMNLPYPVSYIPPAVSTYSSRMSFWQRTRNFLGMSTAYVAVQTHIIAKMDELVQQRYPHLKSIAEATEDVALVLVNVDPVVTVQKPQILRIVDVGCLHCKLAKPLQGELLDFVQDSGEDGFILFSLGTIMKSSTLPQERVQMFLWVFSQLKQKVIWKFEEQLKNIPSNVKTYQWLPQQDVLGHPNIRLFITHGGLGSLQETVYHGVPVVAFPIFAEQPGNAARIVDRNIGELLDIHTVTKETLLGTVQKILQDKRYAENAKMYSKISRDQLSSPLDKAAYWTEYVIRHDDLKHLYVGGSDLNILQYFSLDILGILVAVFLFGLWFTFVIGKNLFLPNYFGQAKEKK